MHVNHYGIALLALFLLSVFKEKARLSPSTKAPVLNVVNSNIGHLCKFPNRALRPLLPTFDD